MKILATTTVALFAFGLLAALPVHAATGNVEGTVPHLSGGVGKGERSRLTSEARDYNLKLVFLTEQSKSYLARVGVTIRSEDGKPLLKAISDGPWFFARLPAGVYQVSAEARNLTLDKRVAVQADQQLRVNFAWPDAND